MIGIIGGGISGLVSALYLEEESVIFEKNKILGGLPEALNMKDI